MWVKNHEQASISEHNTQESYTAFHARTLKKREHSAPGEITSDMKLLYEFWSHFLCRNFNLTMYNDFRKYALEDAREKSMIGMKNLISYYDQVLLNKERVIHDVLAQHYVETVKNEGDGERPALEKLRAAWRNGALELKSRKKIDNLVDPQLREELDR
jgi:la-related protein 1